MKKIDCMIRFFMGAALIVMMMLSFSLTTRAEEESPDDAVSKTAAPLIYPEQMAKSLETVLGSQEKELVKLKVRVDELENLKDDILNEINAYDSQDTAHRQLLLASQLQIEHVENALKKNRQAARTLAEQMEELHKLFNNTSILFVQTDDRIELAQKQISDIRQSQVPDKQKQELASSIQKLIRILEEKKELSNLYKKIYEDIMDRMKIERDEKLALEEKLTFQLETQKKISIFNRSHPYRQIFSSALPEALHYFQNRLDALFTPSAWTAGWNEVRRAGFERWAFFLFLLMSVIALQSHFRTGLQRFEKECEGQDLYYRRMGLFLLRRSLLYLGLTLLFGLYTSFKVSLFDITLGRVLFNIFLFLLLTRWGMDYLDYAFRVPPSPLQSLVIQHLERFFRFLRAGAVIIIMLMWVGGRDNLLTWMARDIISLVLLIWAVFFWKQVKAVIAGKGRDGHPPFDPKRIALYKRWTYAVFGGAQLFNLFGYGNLTNHWIGGWVKTAALLFLGWISLHVIREWHREHESKSETISDGKISRSRHEIRGALIRLTRLLCFMGLSAGIVWAWDSTGLLYSKLGILFNLTAVIGTLQFSVKGVFLAAFILFITHLAVNLHRTLLNEKILEKKSLERGLKDSILTITGYLGWGMGLILALGTLGVNTTSLAVIFGALSVGIGFGLQTIFNNFFSGLILLFERPIQVGDIVEINGLWAKVEKINVRATAVRTFDNAAVLIPNSDLISQQVTNWSFKDNRMRRNIEIGVAYGSDNDLVMKTLLEIAEAAPDTLKYPRPEVLFIDHADSALIFRLRVWVRGEDYWAVPSRIRLEIDRQFRELGIEIAFPQRDLHIRTLPHTAAAGAGNALDTFSAIEQNPDTGENK